MDADALVDVLSVDEVNEAYRRLSKDDLLKLMAIERHLLGGTGRERGDLLHEAFCRTLLGKRPCLRNVPVIAHLAMTMKSIASHDRNHQKRHIQIGDASEADELNAASIVASIDAEELLLRGDAAAKQVVAEIFNLFADDEQAQLVLAGWGDGLRGKDLRNLIAADQAELDYAIKRIRRKVRKSYPNGWTS